MSIRKVCIMIFIGILCFSVCPSFSQEIKDFNKEKPAPEGASIIKSQTTNSISKNKNNGKIAETKLEDQYAKDKNSKNEDNICNGQVKTDTFFQAAFSKFVCSNSMGLKYPREE